MLSALNLISLHLTPVPDDTWPAPQQCLNLLQGDTKPIRNIIETRFEEIKSVSDSKYPFFEIGVSDW